MTSISTDARPNLSQSPDYGNFGQAIADARTALPSPSVGPNNLVTDSRFNLAGTSSVAGKADGAPSASVTIPGTNIRVFDYGSSNSIDNKGKQAIQDVFGFDPSRGEGAAYTYGNGYNDPMVKDETGFSGGTYRDPASGARAAYIYPDRVNDEANKYGIANGEGLVATQEVAQRFVSLEVSRPNQEIVGDAVSVAYDKNYSFKMFQLAAVNHFDTLDPNYRATALVGQQAMGVLMQNYGIGNGNYVDRGAEFLNAFGDYISSKDIPPTTDAFSEQNLRGFASEVLKRNPDRFIADFKQANVLAYKDAAQQVLKQYRPTAP